MTDSQLTILCTTLLLPLATIIVQLMFASKSRRQARAEQKETHNLVNGQSAKIEKLAEEKGHAQGVADEKANPSV